MNELHKKSCEETVPKSPGMKYTHYSPDAQVIIVKGQIGNVADKIKSLSEEYSQKGITVGILATEQTKSYYNGNIYSLIIIGDREKPETIAKYFYSIRLIRSKKCSIILS